MSEFGGGAHPSGYGGSRGTPKWLPPGLGHHRLVIEFLEPFHLTARSGVRAPETSVFGVRGKVVPGISERLQPIWDSGEGKPRLW